MSVIFNKNNDKESKSWTFFYIFCRWRIKKELTSVDTSRNCANGRSGGAFTLHQKLGSFIIFLLCKVEQNRAIFLFSFVKLFILFIVNSTALLTRYSLRWSVKSLQERPEEHQQSIFFLSEKWIKGKVGINLIQVVCTHKPIKRSVFFLFDSLKHSEYNSNNNACKWDAKQTFNNNAAENVC